MLKNFEINTKNIFFDAIFVYPNPVSSICSIKINNPEYYTGTTLVEIINIDGAIEESYNINLSSQASNTEFDFSSFSAGIYFLRLINKDSILTVKINVIK